MTKYTGKNNLKPILDSQRARELQKKSVEKRLQNIQERKTLKELLLERITKEDLEEMIDNVIKRAKNNDKAFEVYRDTIGEKPTDKIDANVELKEIVVKLDDE